MALFTDGPACTIDEMTAEDSGLLATAEAVGINVTQKLWLALSELQTELEMWLARPQPTLGPPWMKPPTIDQVVVTRELARWEKMQALSMVYRDAYFSQLVDRYQGKWDEYAQLTRYARDQFVVRGIGLVTDPMPKAALPVLGAESVQSHQTGGMFYACVTWVNAAGQEGAASDAGSISVPTNNVLTVMASEGPANAIGFNVYAGTVPSMMTLQTQVPLAAGSTFIDIPGQYSSSRIAGNGQKPDYVRALPRTLLRG